MNMKRVYTQEDKESKMRKYMTMKAMGLSDNECANKLQISRGTIHLWKKTEWFEELTERMPWEDNKELQIMMIKKLKRILMSDDTEDKVALEVIDRILTLNRGLNINKRPSGKDDNNVDVFNSDLLIRHRFGDGDE